MSNFSFQRIAPVYDILARMVFGNSIDAAQKVYLHLLPKKSSILIVGGGSGRILPELISLCAPFKITYVEASSNMLRLAKKNVRPQWEQQLDIQFIHGTEEDIPKTDRYDVLMTFFLFDLFGSEEATQLAVRLANFLKPSGYWLIADFQPNSKKRWKQMLLNSMYFFFRLVSQLKNNSLPDYQKIIQDLHFYPVHKKFFYRKFIVSIMYRKLLA